MNIEFYFQVNKNIFAPSVSIYFQQHYYKHLQTFKYLFHSDSQLISIRASVFRFRIC